MSKSGLSAFISYSVKDKAAAADVKAALTEYGISSFLAHNDLRISETWKERILEELKRCDIFVPLLSEEFRKSSWTDQETGIAFSRNDIIFIPLSLDHTVPYGFISHVQGKTVPEDGEWDDILKDALLKHFPRTLIPHLIRNVSEAHSFRRAEAIVKPLVNLFPRFTRKEANQFAKGAVENNQVWSAHLCRTEYLPAFIRAHRSHLRAPILRKLKYQIKYDRLTPE